MNTRGLKQRSRNMGCCFRLGLAVVSLLLAGAPLFGQSPVRPIRKYFFIEAGDTAEKRLATVSEYLQQQRPEAAIDLLREVRRSRPGELIHLGPYRSLSLDRYCDILLTRFPPAGLAAYRQSVDPQAKGWLADYRQTGDADALGRIVDRLFASSVGDQAINRLAEIAWERGEIALARRYWTLLVPLAPPHEDAAAAPAILRYPDTDLDLALIRARLVMCSIARGQHRRARRELAAFRALHKGARGRIAGQEGLLAERLGELLRLPGEPGTAANTWIPRPVPHGTHTLGVRSRRDGALAFDPPLSRPVWRQPLPAASYAVEPVRAALPVPAPLAYYPAVWKDKVFVATAQAIFGFEQSSGRAAWSSGAPVSPQIHPPRLAGDAERPNPPSIPRLGVPRHSLTISGNRLFAALGPPATSWPERLELRHPESRLVCLDLGHQGRLLWTLSGDDLGEKNDRWTFEGPPAAAGGKLYLLATRSRPRSMLKLVCLEAASGNVVWTQSLGTPLNLPSEGTAALTHRVVSYAAGRLYIATDQGAILCASADDGSMIWVAWYHSQPLSAPRPVNRADRGLPARCLVAGGTVVVAPGDSPKLLAYDAVTGRRRWIRDIRGGAGQLIGARDTTLVVAGERLHGLDLATGQTRWTVGFENPAAFGAGLGAFGKDFVYWPTREDLFVVDWRTGSLVRRIRLHDIYGLDGGGNLAASANGLFLAGPEYIIGIH